MNRQLSLPIFAVTAVVTLLQALPLRAQDTLPLSAFLEQVKEKNTGLRGALEAGSGAELRSREAQLLLAPTIFADARMSSDAKQPPIPLMTYDKLVSNTYSLGVSQLTTFGLQARFAYNMNYTSYVNPAVAGTGGSTPLAFPPYHDSQPLLELTQSLWSNGFGRATRANQQLLEAQSLAASFASRFQGKMALSDAETTYWRLALARDNVEVQKAAVERSRKMQDWSKRRSHLHLADGSDELQANAAVELHKLQLQAATDEEIETARAFNSARGLDSDQVPERLTEITLDTLDHLTVPKRGGELRDDVRAAAEQERAQAANSTIALERDSPTLDLFASYSFNGRQADLSNALTDPFTESRPTQAIGVRFSMPIALGVTADSRAGWKKEKIAAEQAYDRKVFEQEVDWRSLNARLAQARKRLQLARAIESAQEAKLTHERTRLQQGRTTSFQVLQFEDDYSQSQLTRIRTQAEVLTLLAQMKLYGDDR